MFDKLLLKESTILWYSFGTFEGTEFDKYRSCFGVFMPRKPTKPLLTIPSVVCMLFIHLDNKISFL